MLHRIQRREFLKGATLAAAAAALAPRSLAAAETAPRAKLVVVHGTDIARMLAAGMQKMGGWGAFIQKGQPATLKPNIGWASAAEQGGNTNPQLVAECIRACQGAGASAVVIPEKPCSPARVSFEMSGIAAVAKQTGARLYELQDDDFRSMKFPRGQTLQQADVAKDILDTGCLINLPVAKTHKGATLTLGMKNWMGSVRDRGFWHRNGLHQCIADFCTAVRPHLTIVDATRIMVTNGPRGPGQMEYPGELIFGTDPVAVDAYAATLFKMEPFRVPYIQIAHDMGIGCGDLSQVTVQRLEA